MKLLLDLGNSRLKWACAENIQLTPVQSLLNYEITLSVLITLWRELKPQKIAISCVGKLELLNLVTAAVHELWGEIPIYFAKSQAAAFGVANGYSQPEKLGVDRWLALIAARQLTTLPVCIVDCGTAITMDVLNDRGEHQGGLICAGLTLMKESLSLNTADLPFAQTAKSSGLAIETEAAIVNGTLLAACGLIEKVMRQLPSTTQLFLTGGDAVQIAAQLTLPFSLEIDLVLQGLNVEPIHFQEK